MTHKPYTEMSDEELDRLAWSRIMKFDDDVLDDTVEVWSSEGEFWWKDWNPTHPKSNQAERYLFPKLSESGGWVVIDYLKQELIVQEVFHVKRCDIIREQWGGERVNRTKVIACLKALDQLEGDKE